MNLKAFSGSLIKGGGLLVGLSALSKCIYSVDPGERAIIFSKFYGGIKTDVYGPGYHFYIPML
jgi:regulator of protease activity HflC (stomatin/prohibitin superfamily)